MSLFFDKNLEVHFSSFTFSREESKHLSKVLRKKRGDLITITNGRGVEWHGELTHVTTASAGARKISATQHAASTKEIHLAIAPTKNNSRMEWLVEKLTELGVASITPLICDRSERKRTKPLRMEKIAIAALKQSQQFFLPEIKNQLPFSEFIENRVPYGYIAHCEQTNKQNLAKCDLNQNSITLLIGPEGDFSSQEIESAEKAGYHSVTIGNQRFRTETAGLLACHTVFLQQHQN
jgi:16S rRNA (uracil1498-N3)-methyltransferase